MKHAHLLIFSMACLFSPSARAETETKKGVVLLVVVTLDNPFFVDLEKGFRSVVDTHPEFELQVRSGVKDNELTMERQVLETFYSKYVEGANATRLKAVAMVPAGANDELTPQIRSLRNSNVPVILMDAKIDAAALKRAGTNYSAYVGSSNRDGGQVGAELLSRCIPRTANVLVLNGPPASEPAVERRAGFLEKLEALQKDSGLKVKVTERIGGWKRGDAYSIVDGLYSLGKTFDGVFAGNDLMALGALEAIRKHPEITRASIVGFDAIDEAKQMVESGEMVASVAQDPFRIGKEGAELMLKILARESVPLDTTIPVKPVVKSGNCASR